MKEIKYLFEKIPDFKITNLLYIKHHTYKEIVEYGENKYIQEILILLSTAFDYKAALYDQCNEYWGDIDELVFFRILIQNNFNTFLFTKPLADYEMYKNTKTQDTILYDPITEDRLTLNDIMVLRDHLNSMLGYMYKEHKEYPANEITKKIMINNDRQEVKRQNQNNQKGFSIKDIIVYSLYNKCKNLENHNCDKYKDSDLYKLYYNSYNMGKADVIQFIADIIIKDLLNTNNI